MAATVDTGNSPIRFTGTGAASATSASFSAPADALLVCCIEYDGSNVINEIAVSDSGGLSWSNKVSRVGSESTVGGLSQLSTARTTSVTSRQVTVTIDPVAGTNRISAKLYVVTGADVNGTPVDTVGVNNEGGSGTNDLTTTSLTPAANGLLFVADCDWAALGGFDASSDLTQDTTTYAGAISVCDGYKVCTGGLSVTANLNAAAGTPQHKWCQIIVLEDPAGGAPADELGTRDEFAIIQRQG